ncbi:MAG TPA: hypothetical protein VFY84_11110 [Jiangellales bacterium]|nr:hypothetical protein [Jiangellales bacterium]
MTQPTNPPAGEPQATNPPTNPSPEPTKTATPPAGDPPKDDKPLGPPGEKALAAEREARKALEKQLAELAPLKQIADLLGGKPTGDAKSDLEKLTERIDGYEKQIADERKARWRVEIATEKGLPPALAARLQGATREELAADAEALKALIPATPDGPRTPAPDPTQGARGPVDIDALIADAEAKGDIRTAVLLKTRKLTQTQ